MSKMPPKSTPDTLEGRTLAPGYLGALKRRIWEGVSTERNAHMVSKRGLKQPQNFEKSTFEENTQNKTGFGIVFEALGAPKFSKIRSEDPPNSLKENSKQM